MINETNETMGEQINLKEFKKMIRKLGYKVKTYTYSSSNLRFLSILDNNKNFICGSGANVYTTQIIEKHKEIFDLLNKYRSMVFDFDYEKPIKVIF